ncbi:MAG: ECF-type sigma factor [Gemmatimonadota bacterium]|nr:ECF-type sigma factor [Gemmatimonadota bacterium]
MTTESPDEVTIFLRRWRDGDRDAFDALLPRVYERLRDMAHARLRAEHPDHTLDTSALVHEAYLRMIAGATPDWQDRAHFFAVCSTAMRRILIDHAKQRLAQKRGGAAEHVSLDAASGALGITAAAAEPDALVALDEALTKLAVQHERPAKAIELRYFAGLTLEEAAQVLGTSAPTVLRDLRFGQAWLARALG